MPTRSAPVLIRNSERQTFKRCRHQWEWNFVRLLKPEEEAPALRFGDLTHRALERHYPPGIKRGPKPWIVFDRLYKADLRKGKEEFRMWTEDDSWADAREVGIHILRRYYERYHDMDEQFRVLSSEQVFQVPVWIDIPELGKKRKQKVLIVGTMDGLWQDRSGPKKQRSIFIKEYKTTGSAITQIIAGLPMDEQAGTYWTFGPEWMWEQGILPQGVFPSHIWYTIMRKVRDDDRPENAEGLKLNNDGTVSKKQPAPALERERVYRDAADRERMRKRIMDEAREMILARHGLVATYKNPGPLYNQNCKGCAFKGPCELHEAGQDYESMLRAMYKKWKPYAAHELPERW